MRKILLTLLSLLFLFAVSSLMAQEGINGTDPDDFQRFSSEKPADLTPQKFQMVNGKVVPVNPPTGVLTLREKRKMNEITKARIEAQSKPQVSRVTVQKNLAPRPQ